MSGRRVAAGFPYLLVLLLTTPAAREAPVVGSRGPAGILTLVLGPDGALSTWKGGDSLLSPLPPSLSRLAGHPANDLAMATEGGRVVVLPVATLTPGRHHRLAGSAVVISSPTPAAQPAILNEIPFEGDGRRVVVSRDGRSAYVLAFPSLSDPATGDFRVRLLALDLEEGRVVGSAELDRPPSALAIDPEDRRVFLSYAGRIQTYTTRPLAQSWFYRSPGANRGLCFRPGEEVLYIARQDQVARFDPRIMTRRNPEERQKLRDDSTEVFPLPFAADSLLFSRDGGRLAAYGPQGGIAFVEPSTGAVSAAALAAEGTVAQRTTRPFYFDAGSGALFVAAFPDRRVMSLSVPEASRPSAAPGPDRVAIRAPEKPPEASPTPAQVPVSAPAPVSTPAPEPRPSVAAVPAATPPPVPSPAPPEAAPPAIVATQDGPAWLSGRLSGDIGVVGTIVIYGPGSIVREQARAQPGADGTWRVPLPGRGTYRIVPLAKGARPLRVEPNFRTLDVQEQSVTGLDFRILGTS